MLMMLLQGGGFRLRERPLGADVPEGQLKRRQSVQRREAAFGGGAVFRHPGSSARARRRSRVSLPVG